MKKITFLTTIILAFLMQVGYAQSVGINSNGSTPDPSAMLDVKSSNKGFLPPRIALAGTTDVSTISSPVAGLLVYNTSNTNDVTPGYYYYGGSSWIKVDAGLWSFDLEEDISTTYNVGIGTTAPQHKFVVAGNGWSQFMTNTDAHNPSASENYGVYIGSNRSGGATEGNIAYHNYLTFAKWDGTTYSETIRIDASGNVGIGTTTPTALLDVEGIIRSTTVSLGRDNEIWNSGDASDAGAMYVNHRGYNDSFDYYRDTHICDGKQQTIAFFDGSSGYVGIGTASPSYTLDVAGDFRANGGDIYFPNLYTFQTQNYSDLRINPSNGKIAVEKSSKRYKENIKDMEDVGWIYNLRPVNFNLKADPEKSKAYGLIAEEVAEVAPEFVFYKDNVIQGVTYSKFISPLIKVIQVQKKSIENLENQITAQQQQIDALKSQNTENINLLRAEIENLKKATYTNTQLTEKK